MLNLRPIELFLIQLSVYFLLWFWNDYIAFLISSVFAVILIAILIVSLIAEMIEKSKVSKTYFQIMGVSILAPVLAGLIYVIFTGNGLSF